MTDLVALHAAYRRRMEETEATPEFQQAKAERRARQEADRAYFREVDKGKPPLRGYERGGSAGAYSAGRG